MDVIFRRVLLAALSASEWASANPILAAGEPAYETDTGILRIGDGVTQFTSLPAYGTYPQIQAAQAAVDEAAQQAALDADRAEAAQAVAITKAGEAGADAAQVALDKAAAQQALADAQEVAYGEDPVFGDLAATGTVKLPGLPELAGGLGLALSILGALARRINGEGAISLAGGSLADPALTIGDDVKVYAASADTLSLAIADTEVLRITAAGITVYGTVTEA